MVGYAIVAAKVGNVPVVLVSVRPCRYLSSSVLCGAIFPLVAVKLLGTFREQPGR
jgi:hypothetical protein